MVGKWYGKPQMTCTGCGHVSRSAGEEARHRHNFPALCKPKAVRCVCSTRRIDDLGRREDGFYRFKQCSNKTTDPTGLCHRHRKYKDGCAAGD